jgi:hypothetical protein
LEHLFTLKFVEMALKQPRERCLIKPIRMLLPRVKDIKQAGREERTTNPVGALIIVSAIRHKNVRQKNVRSRLGKLPPVSGEKAFAARCHQVFFCLIFFCLVFIWLISVAETVAPSHSA